MARKLAYTVHVLEKAPIDAERPELGVTVTRQETFLAGSELPKWARSLVGDHVYEEGSEADEAETEADAPVEADGAAPAGNASLEAWQEFARSKGASDEDIEGKSRNELREQFGA